jgi:prepilin-type processing-associated H-X9-DG protein
MIMYSGDYKDYIVPVSGGADQRPLWTDSLAPFLTDANVLICPAETTKVMSGGYAPIQTVTTGYGAYCYVFGQPLPIFKNTSSTVLITDANAFLTHVPVITLGAGGAACADGALTFVSSRHDLVSAFLFLDGHVAASNPAGLYSKTVHWLRQ